MTAVMPTNKIRVAIATLVLDLKGIILKAKEIADNVRRMARPYQGVEKDKADTLESYTRRSTNPYRIERHQPPSRKTLTAVLGRRLAERRKIGVARSGDKPTKLGKRNMLDGSKIFKVDHRVVKLVAYEPLSPAMHLMRIEGTIMKPRSGKNFAGWKTPNVSVSVVDESARPATTALTAMVTVIEVRALDFTVMDTTALDLGVEVMSRVGVGCMILAFALPNTVLTICTIRNLISAGWVMGLGNWSRILVGDGPDGRTFKLSYVIMLDQATLCSFDTPMYRFYNLSLKFYPFHALLRCFNREPLSSLKLYQVLVHIPLRQVLLYKQPHQVLTLMHLYQVLLHIRTH